MCTPRIERIHQCSATTNEGHKASVAPFWANFSRFIKRSLNKGGKFIEEHDHEHPGTLQATTSDPKVGPRQSQLSAFTTLDDVA